MDNLQDHDHEVIIHRPKKRKRRSDKWKKTIDKVTR